MTEPAVGTVLGGKFAIEGVLGRGGMGVVYAARHLELDQRVAIKCLLPEALSTPGMVERFSREARAAARIQGSHVARVIDVGRFDDGTPYIVMEYLHGRDLAAELEARGPLPVPEAVRYVLESCEALAQAHVARIVHRDLKPSNLFLAEVPGRRPIVKVLDFGISKFDGGASALTDTRSALGTPFYMSPEQLLSSRTVDERSDIWALGVILYELLAGTTPFLAETSPEVIARIVQNTPAAPRALRPDLPAELEAVILRCMRGRADERYATVAQLALALLPFADPADRGSAMAIARVLGIPDSVLEADVDPSAPTQEHPPVGPGRVAVDVAPTELPAASTPPVAQPARTAPLATAANVSLSAGATTAGAGRGKGWLWLGGGGLVAAVGTAIALRASAPHAPEGAAGLAAPIAPSPPVASSPVALLAPLDPGSPPAASAPAIPNDPAAPAVASPPAPSSRPPASASPRAVAPARASAAPAPVPAPASAPSAPHNPLDLQIK